MVHQLEIIVSGSYDFWQSVTNSERPAVSSILGGESEWLTETKKLRQ